MLEFLKLVIEKLERIYSIACIMWERDNKYSFNQRKRKVKQIFADESIWNNIIDYLKFLNCIFPKPIEVKDIMRCRIKDELSCRAKVMYYTEVKKEKGNIPIQKCVNDLLGFRIIVPEKVEFKDVNDIIEKNFPDFKCVEKNKDGYKAIHVYLIKDNFYYQWELQIWNKEDETNNIKSHNEHKQKHIKWVEEKGGVRDVL